MRHLVRFKGGPLGGEVQEIDVQGPRLLVPALQPTSAFWRDGLGRQERYLPFQSETYEIMRSWDGGYEAQWIHPSESIILENEKLKRRIRELEELEALLDAMQPFLRRVG